MLKLMLALSAFYFVVNVSQGTTTITSTKKIITSFEPTTVTETSGTPIATNTSSTITTETETETESEPSTEITEPTDTNPPPIGTDTTRTPTFRTTTPSTTPYRHSTYPPPTTFPPLPPPVCCGQNEFSHYSYAGVPKYCDPICNNLTKVCLEVFYPSTLDCYCLPGCCRDPNYRCVPISDIKKHCHLKK